ncbi:MAG TPA: DUF6438 domain-containing protein [Pyrinomonadaceae bacterium]|jgi:hypothetical protein
MSRWVRVLMLGTFLASGSANYARSPLWQGPTPSATKPQAERGEAVIALRREPGYWGLGPTYTLLIYADGRVVFIGQSNVKTKGIAEGNITQEQLQQLVRAFEEIGYFSLLDSYGEGGGCPFYLTDGPTARTELRLKDKKKAVFHDSGCAEEVKKGELLPYPKGLTSVEDLIDAVTKSSQWVGGR